MDDTCIEELTTRAAFREAYPVVKQLRPIDEETYLDLLDEMRTEDGYRLYGLREDGNIRALAGLGVQTTFDHGTHVWVYDLVVDEAYRGEGYGSELLDWLAQWADDRDCSCLELASGLWRDGAHEFYEQNDMEKYCFTFKRELSAESPY
jgi:GNAT superfamily N-acetyltransferase